MRELNKLFQVIIDRKKNPVEGSYTCYLFEKGLDKILKKCGEECSEVIIAAKSLEALRSSVTPTDGNADLRSDLENEICDLLYHVLVLLVETDVSLDSINDILARRSLKIGNLKQFAPNNETNG
jgi:phosphoribosyl-ATP pyrophosphohydrolase